MIIGIRTFIDYIFAAKRLDIARSDYVLEVGSGARPYLRSDILLDKSIKPYERAGKLVKDRPLVIADAQYLPFKDKSFDFIIAAHILEHLEMPDKFINEIGRVGKGGYIETPSPFAEIIFGHSFHKWFVYIKEETLILSKKEQLDSKTNDLMNYYWIHNKFLQKFVKNIDKILFTKLLWKESIPFSINNLCQSQEDIMKEFIPGNISLAQSHRFMFKLRSKFRKLISNIYRLLFK